MKVRVLPRSQEAKLLEMKILSNRFREWFWKELAWLLPKNLVMWATIRLIAHATQGKYGTTIVPELTAMEALERWE